MGTWDHGLLDNDAAYDGLGDLRQEIVEDLVNFGTAKPTTAEIDKVCAAVGLLLQLSASDFDPESPNAPKIVAALTIHAASSRRSLRPRAGSWRSSWPARARRWRSGPAR